LGLLSEIHGCASADAAQDEQTNDHEAEQRLFTELPPNIRASQSQHKDSSSEKDPRLKTQDLGLFHRFWASSSTT
jgi:hypothetical protein